MSAIQPIFEELLDSSFEDLKLGDLFKSCLITAYDLTRRKAHFFNITDTANTRSAKDFYLRDVVRSSSAVPTSLQPSTINSMDRSVFLLIDGGVVTNNLAICACVEVFTMNSRLHIKDLKVLSIGTGAITDFCHYSGAKNWGKVSWILPVIDIMMFGVAETLYCQLENFLRCSECIGQYLRLEDKE